MKRRNFLEFLAGLPALALLPWSKRQKRFNTFFIAANGSDKNAGNTPDTALFSLHEAINRPAPAGVRVVYLITK